MVSLDKPEAQQAPQAEPVARPITIWRLVAMVMLLIFSVLCLIFIDGRMAAVLCLAAGAAVHLLARGGDQPAR